MDLETAARDEQLLTKRRNVFQKKVRDAFKMFDREGTDTCDVREVGTVIRYLGLNPTQKQLASMLAEMEEDEPTGFVRYAKFEKVVLSVVVESEYKGELLVRETEENLLRAFSALDAEGIGYIEAERFKEMMTSQGEKMTADEIEEMMNVAVDPETGNVKFEDFAAILSTE